MFMLIQRRLLLFVVALSLMLPAITHAAPERKFAQTDGTYVVWLEGNDWNNTRLVVAPIQKDLSLGKAQVLTEHFAYPMNQVQFDLIGGGVVAWREVYKGQVSIVMRDLNKKNAKNVTILTVPETTKLSVPSVAVRQIAWAEDQTVKRYDVNQAKTTTIISYPLGTYVTEPQISGGWIVWSTSNALQRDEGRATLSGIALTGIKVRIIDAIHCGQVCPYLLSGDQVLYFAGVYTTAMVRNISTSKKVIRSSENEINWHRVDGRYVFDTGQAKTYDFVNQRYVTLPFIPSDVRDGWVVGIENNTVKVSKMSLIDK